MRTQKAFALLTICTLSALSIPTLNPHQAAAQPVDTYSKQANCRKLATGTYLTTISTATGELASRSIITLTKDGNILVADSNQGGVPGAFNAFGEAQGAWKCNGNQITATTLSFSYPGTEGSTGSIGKSNYSVTFDQQNQTVQGTITLRFSDLQADPFSSDAPVAGTFTITGQRVTAD